MPQYEKKNVVKVDDLENLVTSMNSGTDRLQSAHYVNSGIMSYAELAAMYCGWLGRRIVDLVPNEALKRGWNIVCPDWEESKIERLDEYCQSVLSLPSKLLTCLKNQRWAGGGLMVAIINQEFGAFCNPIPKYLPANTLLSIQPFDAWEAVPALIDFQNVLSKEYRLPISYAIGASGMITEDKNGQYNAQGTLVHCSRVERFDGLELPWYERSRNLYWGQSLLSSAYTAVRNSNLVDTSVATLLFRASVPVLKVPDLASIVSDCNSRQAFLDRVNMLNYGMSNNNMALIDQEETLESFEPGSLTNLDGVLERFYIIVSAATGIPVVKLVGESARGLNATGEGDLNNYYDLLEDYQRTTVKPALLSMYRRWIVPSFFDELCPATFDIEFPPLERSSEKEKQEANSTFLSMIRDALDSELIDKEVAVRELQRQRVFSTFSEDDMRRVLSKKSVEEDNDFGDALKVADELYKHKILKKGREK